MTKLRNLIKLRSYFNDSQLYEKSDKIYRVLSNESTSLKRGIDYLENYGFNIEEIKRQYVIEKVEIESSLDGHLIPADYILANHNKDTDTVIMAHGLGGNRLTVYPIAQLFLEAGYNVIAYDQRSSGENTAPYTTFGYWESKDLIDYVRYADGLLDSSNKIIVWGTSFGGATAGIALGDDDVNQKVDYAILDCPISNMSYMLSTSMEHMDIGIPVQFLMVMGNITTKMKLGFSYEDTNVIHYTSKTNVPTLIINSKVDQVTPYFMGEDIYHSIKGDKKQLFTVEDSKHAEIIWDYPSEYKTAIMSFINE